MLAPNHGRVEEKTIQMLINIIQIRQQKHVTNAIPPFSRSYLPHPSYVMLTQFMNTDVNFQRPPRVKKTLHVLIIYLLSINITTLISLIYYVININNSTPQHPLLNYYQNYLSANIGTSYSSHHQNFRIIQVLKMEKNFIYIYLGFQKKIMNPCK